MVEGYGAAAEPSRIRIGFEFRMGNSSKVRTHTTKLVLALATPSLTVNVIVVSPCDGEVTIVSVRLGTSIPEAGATRMSLSLITLWSDDLPLTVKVGDGETELLTWKLILALDPPEWIR